MVLRFTSFLLYAWVLSNIESFSMIQEWRLDIDPRPLCRVSPVVVQMLPSCLPSLSTVGIKGQRNLYEICCWNPLYSPFPEIIHFKSPKQALTTLPIFSQDNGAKISGELAGEVMYEKTYSEHHIRIPSLWLICHLRKVPDHEAWL